MSKVLSARVSDALAGSVEAYCEQRGWRTGQFVERACRGLLAEAHGGVPELDDVMAPGFLRRPLAPKPADGGPEAMGRAQAGRAALEALALVTAGLAALAAQLEREGHGAAEQASALARSGAALTAELSTPDAVDEFLAGLR